MGNRISFHTNGLIKLNSSLNFEEVLSSGFEFIGSENWAVNYNTETEIEIFMKEDKKLIRIISTVETESEGTLTYQSTWVDPFFSNLFGQNI